MTPLRWATAWLLASALAVVLPVQAAKKKALFALIVDMEVMSSPT